MFGLRPRVACRSQWARIATLQRNTAFEHAHAAAQQRLLRGEVANFPLGTIARKPRSLRLYPLAADSTTLISVPFYRCVLSC